MATTELKPRYMVEDYEEARRIVNKRAAASGDAYSLDLQLTKDIAESLTRVRVDHAPNSEPDKFLLHNQAGNIIYKVFGAQNLKTQLAQKLADLQDGITAALVVAHKSAAPRELKWTKEFSYNDPGVYWVRLVESPGNHVIAYCSKEHIHYTNGERELASSHVGKYEFLGPITHESAPNLEVEKLREVAEAVVHAFDTDPKGIGKKGGLVDQLAAAARAVLEVK